MRSLMSRAPAEYDFVVIDTPPTTVVSDAVPLLTQVSGVLVVVRLGKSTRQAAKSLRNQLTTSTRRRSGSSSTPRAGARSPTGTATSTMTRTSKRSRRRRRSRREETVKEVAEVGRNGDGDIDDAETNLTYSRLVSRRSAGPRRVRGACRGQGRRDRRAGAARRRPHPAQAVHADRAARNGSRANGWHVKAPERQGEPDSGEVVYLFASECCRLAMAGAGLGGAPRPRFALEFIEEFCQAAGGSRWPAGWSIPGTSIPTPPSGSSSTTATAAVPDCYVAESEAKPRPTRPELAEHQNAAWTGHSSWSRSLPMAP